VLKNALHYCQRLDSIFFTQRLESCLGVENVEIGEGAPLLSGGVIYKGLMELELS
jgi:hypothetical protein